MTIRRVHAPGPVATTLVTAVLLLLLGAATLWSLRPPTARPASAAPTAFSADRALAMLPDIAAAPRPAGSRAAANVRSHLVEELRRLGLEPTVQSRVAVRSPQGTRPAFANVANVHARLPGSEPTGRVLLVAHHDSVPTGPGASDNGANVVAALEIVRALRSAPTPRNDVDVVFTDAEEVGLLGAQAFVDSGIAGDPRRVAVVNLEARGVSGPAVMFEMEGGLTSAVADASAVTTSFADTVYGLLPNDTDLTVLTHAGMRGINLAYFEGVAHYHTAHDDLGRVDPASVQHMGQTALGAVKSLAAADLSRQESEACYFSAFGTVVSYPAWLTLPAALLLAGGYVVLVLSGRRHGVRPVRVALAAGSLAPVLVASLGVGIGGWWLLQALQPQFGFGIGAVYHPAPYVAAGFVLQLALLVVWYRWARRRSSLVEIVTGVLGWFALLAMVCAFLLPGGAYLFTWPAVVGTAALAVARTAAPESRWRTPALAAAAAPATVPPAPGGGADHPRRRPRAQRRSAATAHAARGDGAAAAGTLVRQEVHGGTRCRAADRSLWDRRSGDGGEPAQRRLPASGQLGIYPGG